MVQTFSLKFSPGWNAFPLRESKAEISCNDKRLIITFINMIKLPIPLKTDLNLLITIRIVDIFLFELAHNKPKLKISRVQNLLENVFSRHVFRI